MPRHKSVPGGYPHQVAVRLNPTIEADLIAAKNPEGMSGEIRKRLEDWKLLRDAGYTVERVTKTNILTPLVI